MILKFTKAAWKSLYSLLGGKNSLEFQEGKDIYRTKPDDNGKSATYSIRTVEELKDRGDIIKAEEDDN